MGQVEELVRSVHTSSASQPTLVSMTERKRYVVDITSCILCRAYLLQNLKAYAGHAWAVLKCFGYNTIFDELNGSGIHRLENILTLDVRYHRAFDELKLWFEPIVSLVPLICNFL